MSLRSFIALIALSLVLSCVTTRRTPSVLKDQILTFIPGFKGPVYRFCETEDCEHPVYTDYDFSQRETRERFINARMICDVGGVPYGPCYEIDGICNFVHKRPILGIIGKEKAVLQRSYSFSLEYQKLIDAKAACYHMSLYPLGVK